MRISAYMLDCQNNASMGLIHKKPRVGRVRQWVCSFLTTAMLMGIGPVIRTAQAQDVANFNGDQYALTGSWYNPDTSGQGLVFEVYPDFTGAGIGYLAGGWFTFDTSGNQHWYSLQGAMTAAQGAAFALNIYDTAGGNFNAPPAANPVEEGTATLTFTDCTNASLTYQFNDGRSGTIPQTRITQFAPLPSCYGLQSGIYSTPATLIGWSYSGAWYNPGTSGQGVYLDMAPMQNTFFAAWFTYAPQSPGPTESVASQRWFTIQGNYSMADASIQQVPIYATTGIYAASSGSVGTSIATTTQPVGTADITFNSCSSMTLNYTFTSGEFKGLSGTLNEQPVGTLGPSCPVSH